MEDKNKINLFQIINVLVFFDSLSIANMLTMVATLKQNKKKFDD